MTREVELLPGSLASLLDGSMTASALRSAQHTILVIDNEESSRLLMAGVLADEGYRVITSIDVAQALALLKKMGPGVHLVISDIMMPRMSGIDLSARLAETLYSPPILFVAGSHGLTGVPGPVLHKPFRPRDLTALVQTLLEIGNHTASKPVSLV